ncbi:hypothetical protein DY000_02019265 [Brassica cretica]|uniref:Small-subunit processome Utp12 domain-containing protein n=1 Tax=Brassica cretica TaxID=69181 RepID=A0ABQ7D6P6_BRACR|nr:hypothetical protein DY000_02019265 [Brassica cretica]
MNLVNIKDVLTSFSPALDFLALSTGDGRIKIWDTVKGQVQTEFADIASAEETNIYTSGGKGHLSLDYTCMKWLSLERKKKRKLGTSILVLGTGGGDVLALDVASGQLKWRISDCHPGGVNAVSSSTKASCIYSGGADGMVCEIDPHSGNLIRKFKASTKAVSSLSVSPVKGQVQTEFADIASAEETNIYTSGGKGHLSLDYTCMKWLSLERKKKRKLGTSILVLGTGGGDVLALDVASGQLKWRISDCHPGGVNAVSSSTKASCIYSGGADGMVCEIDPHSGNLIRKFKASTKAVSSLSVSPDYNMYLPTADVFALFCFLPDGKILATASAQLKTFKCSDLKKIQKFTGHPGGVRCVAFTEDGKFILSSAVGEKYIAVWKTDGAKKQSASCVLALEHPPVFVDSWGETDEKGLYVLAISEVGVCYFWYGSNVEELSNAKPTKVALATEDYSSLKQHKGSLPTIFAAKLQGVLKPGSANAFIASGLLVKPSFQKMVLQFGNDLVLNASKSGILLPIAQSASKSKKGQASVNRVTTLDRAHAEDALLPIARVADMHEKKSVQPQSSDKDTDMVDQSQADYVETFSMEDKLRSLGILKGTDEPSSLSYASVIDGIDLEAHLPPKKLKSAVLSMAPSTAFKTLEALVAMWQTRGCGGRYLLPWIYSIMVYLRLGFN